MEMTAHALADNQRDYERKSHSLEWISYREIDSYGLLLHPMPVRRFTVQLIGMHCRQYDVMNYRLSVHRTFGKS